MSDERTYGGFLPPAPEPPPSGSSVPAISTRPQPAGPQDRAPGRSVFGGPDDGTARPGGPPAPGRRPRHDVALAESRWRGAARLLIAIAVVDAVLIAVDAAWALALRDERAAAMPDTERLEAFEGASATVGALQSLGFLVTALAFLLWFRAADRAVRELGATGHRLGPAWSLWGWVIPVGNLVIPKLMTNDLWRGAGGPDARAGGVPGWLDAWWGAWLVAGVFSVLAATALADADSLREQQDAATLEALATGIHLVAALLALRLVREVAARLRASDAATR